MGTVSGYPLAIQTNQVAPVWIGFGVCSESKILPDHWQGMPESQLRFRVAAAPNGPQATGKFGTLGKHATGVEARPIDALSASCTEMMNWAIPGAPASSHLCVR